MHIFTKQQLGLSGDLKFIFLMIQDEMLVSDILCFSVTLHLKFSDEASLN